MARDKTIKDMLERLEPIASLNETSVEKLAEVCKTEKVEAGRTVFERGDSAGHSVYLVSGVLKLVAVDGESAGMSVLLSSDSPDAMYPVGDREPRQVSAVAETDVEIIRIDNDLMDQVITEDQLEACKTSITDTDQKAGSHTGGFLQRLSEKATSFFNRPKVSVNKDALVSGFRKSPLFAQLSEDNLAEMFDKMEPVSMKAGSVVVKQGAEGDYYYLIANGSTEVTRKTSADAQPVFLAELAEGQGFGEESLVSNAKRNATVTMKTKGVLLRLSKQDFVRLLKEPLLHWISAVDAQDEVRKGAKWLDVRSSAEYQASHLPGAVSMPLHELRERAGELEKDKLYVCCCSNGRLSSSAVFLLAQRSLKCAVLRGGVQRLSV